MAKVSGPVPQAVRRRRNKDEKIKSKGERVGITNYASPDPKWRQDVRNFFNAHFHSGQKDFYENSDMMTLYIQCELLDRILRASRKEPRWERDEEGKYVKDVDGNKIQALDDNGEPDFITIGSINGQALRSVIDMSQDLLATEGARRKLRIDLGLPSDEDEDPGKVIAARQRKTVGVVK